MSQKIEKFKLLLDELFRLDQPDLDFGIYRIMGARNEEITKYLDEGLLPEVKNAFEQYQSGDIEVLEKEIEVAIKGAKAAGFEPDESPRVIELKEKVTEMSIDLGSIENEVFDHLYNFFRRYFDKGDFLSKRVYKPGVYAIPYEGQEVKLQWSNSDQYYVKTSEYLRNYSFYLQPDNEQNPMRVTFELNDVDEGEHGNKKEQDDKKRRFQLAPEPFHSLGDNELTIRFTQKTESTKQKKINDGIEKSILDLKDKKLIEWIEQLKEHHTRSDKTESDKTRLRIHIDGYTKRNNSDYFIHKDLGGFLHRELDFFIKNEVMYLDDIENETAPKVEQFLSKIKVIRSIATKVIQFLAQIEDFQKKLWLKRKFVVETNYCITLDRIPIELYPEIAVNEAQCDEWVKLFEIDMMEPNLFHEGYSRPLSIEFLKANTYLVLDTKFFDTTFIANLLDSFDDFDNQCNGLLIRSENFQALNMLLKKYQKSITLSYIDPPFNLGELAEYLYKVDYKNSTWLSLLWDRMELSKELITDTGSKISRCGHDGNMLVRMIMDELFGVDNHRNEIIVRRAEESKGSLNKQFSSLKSVTVNYDNLYWYSINKNARFDKFWKPISGEKSKSHWHDFWKAFDRPHMRYDILGINLNDRGGQWMWGKERTDRAVKNYNDFLKTSNEKVNKIPSEKDKINKLDAYLDDYWNKNKDRYLKEQGNDLEFVTKRGSGKWPIKYWIPPRTEIMADNNWLDIKGYANKWDFKTENSEGLLKRIIETLSSENESVLDYFAGSGTTAAVAHKLRRKWITIEMGDHFETVLLPRLIAVLNGEKSGISKEVEWKGGGCFKYVVLESYEDTLNNLQLNRNDEQKSLFDFDSDKANIEFKEQYLLNYMLELESADSQSLLNLSHFVNPTEYKMKIKLPNSFESHEINIDLIETFNWLIGITVKHISKPQFITAEFIQDGEGRLCVDGELQPDGEGAWWFRAITGTLPDGRQTLVIWRNRPGGEDTEGVERDNLMLNEWFSKQEYDDAEEPFNFVYVNGSNNLEVLKKPEDNWSVRMIEDDFFNLMFE